MTAAFLNDKFGNAYARYDYQKDHKDLMVFIQRGHGVLTPFQGELEGIWKPRVDHDQLSALLVKIPVSKDFHTYKPWNVIAHFKDMCAMGGFLHVFNSSVDMMVSEYQGNTQTDPIKHNTVFIKYLMTATDSC